MKGFFVTIVDVLGIFVPGFLLLVGILLFPPITNDLAKQGSTWSSLPEAIRANVTVLVILFAIVSYVLGFLIRLWSMRLLQTITMHRWSAKLAKRAQQLQKAIESNLNDDLLCKCLKTESELLDEDDPGYHAPYFHFVKRVVRSGHPTLWAEAERLEAEIRFAAGLLIPFFVLMIDGLFLLVKRTSLLGAVLFVISGIGLYAIFAAFPSRRIREVMYDHYLALIVLRNARAPISSSEEKSDTFE